jgi:hypothetical protein
MRCRQYVPVMVVALSLAGVIGTGSWASQEADGPRWLTDYDAARVAARQSGKPIFLVFR